MALVSGTGMDTEQTSVRPYEIVIGGDSNMKTYVKRTVSMGHAGMFYIMNVLWLYVALN